MKILDVVNLGIRFWSTNVNLHQHQDADLVDFVVYIIRRCGRLKTQAQQPSQHWYSLFYGQEAVKQPADRKHAVLQQIADFEFRFADFND